MVEMILENSKKLVEAGMEVNEVIKATGNFLAGEGFSKSQVAEFQVALKLSMDEDFSQKYAEWVANEM